MKLKIIKSNIYTRTISRNNFMKELENIITEITMEYKKQQVTLNENFILWIWIELFKIISTNAKYVLNISMREILTKQNHMDLLLQIDLSNIFLTIIDIFSKYAQAYHLLCCSVFVCRFWPFFPLFRGISTSRRWFQRSPRYAPRLVREWQRHPKKNYILNGVQALSTAYLCKLTAKSINENLKYSLVQACEEVKCTATALGNYTPRAFLKARTARTRLSPRVMSLLLHLECQLTLSAWIEKNRSL